MTDLPVERFEVSLNTPAGQLTMPVEVPISFVPVTAIVPLMRRLSEQVQALEERKSILAGHPISCRMGCAACCRMLVPVSAPRGLGPQGRDPGAAGGPRRGEVDQPFEAAGGGGAGGPAAGVTGRRGA